MLATLPQNTIIIAGAGIAGLTAALCLAKRGFKVCVMEQATALTSIGAGIQLSPNALSVLNWLKILEDIRNVANVPQNIRINNLENGRLLAQISMNTGIFQTYNFPWLVIHRKDLQNILLNNCRKNPNISISLSSKVYKCTFQKNSLTTTIRKNNKELEIQGNVLIGADGVNSILKTQIFSAPKPKFTGYNAWRGIIPITNKLPSEISLSSINLFLGVNKHIVAYPISDGKYLNLVLVCKEGGKNKNSKIGAEARPQIDYENTCNMINKIIPLCYNWAFWPIYECNPNYKWVYRSAALIGDAAHAMPPYLAQGAAMAVEDAYIIAKFLEKNRQDPQNALAEYEKERKPRIMKIWNQSRKNGKIYHLKKPFSWLRNITLSLSPETLLKRQNNWIYSWNAN